MKAKLLGILLTSTLMVTSLLSVSGEHVYADNMENTGVAVSEEIQLQGDALMEAGNDGYIESNLDNNAPAYDSGIALYSETPSSFPGDMSVFDDVYPSVRNQNPYGTCWAFASIGMLEFDLINDGSADNNIDLSELQLAYNMYNFVTDPLGGTEGDIAKYYNENGPYSYLNRGGNFEFASRRLAQWSGPTSEINVPYSLAESTLTTALDDKYAYSYDEAHLKNTYLINMDTNVSDVKTAIMEYGAVGASYSHYDHGFVYNQDVGSYVYCDDGKKGGGHAVMIVGWDDNFSKDNFEGYCKPANDGAWLIRNSWGSWCGYFWMSYDTVSLASTAWVFDAVSADNDEVDNNYQADGGLYVYPTSVPIAANVFTVQQNNDDHYYEKLRQVSLSFTNAADVHYKIEVYTDLANFSDPLSGTKQEQATTEGDTMYAGVYTIDLDNPVDLEPGSMFAVVVTVDKQSLDQEQAQSVVDGDTMIWDCRVSQYNGKSLYSYSGSSFRIAPGGNYCIKAFTSNEEKSGVTQNQLIGKGYSVSLTENIGANLYAELSPDILSDGEAKVRFTYQDGTYKENPLSDFETTTYDGDTVKKLTYETVPAKLTETVDVSIIKSDGTQSNSFAFSPADYLNELINEIQTDDGRDGLEKNIAQALLDYGAYSQLYFDENTSDMANKNLTDNAVDSLSVDDILNATVDENTALLSNDDLEYIGSSLVCTSGTVMKLYFVNKNSLTLQQIEEKYNIVVLNDKVDRDGNCEYDVCLDGSLFYIKIKDIKPYQLPLNFTIALTSSQKTLQGVVSPFSYIRKAVQGNDTKLQNLCKAMYLYGRAAENLIH